MKSLCSERVLPLIMYSTSSFCCVTKGSVLDLLWHLGWFGFNLWIVRAEPYIFKYVSKRPLKCKSKVLALFDHFLLSHLNLQIMSLRALGFVGSLCALLILTFSYTIINIFNGDFWKVVKRKEEGESRLISETFMEMQLLHFNHKDTSSFKVVHCSNSYLLS